jgi:regulator of sigma E protease
LSTNWGIFWLPKKNGVRVDEFGFGFPPRIFGIKKGETIYSINAIPLGGFVKIYGEDGGGSGSRRSFTEKSLRQKLLILFAGVSMNFILAVLLFGLGHFIGLPTAIDEGQVNLYPEAKLQIISLSQNSPAENAGVMAGDVVLGLKDAQGGIFDSVKKPSEFQEFISAQKGKEITVIVQRGKERMELPMIPRLYPPSGEGPLGVALATVAKISLPWYRALFEGFLTTVNLMGALLIAAWGIVRNLFIEGRAGIEVVGPVGIFTLTGQAATLGFIYLLQLTAMLSINLAVINAFPFPALDGGRALFLVIEKIKGSPINPKIQNVIHNIGFALLILLMIAVTYKDIVRFF